MTKDEMHARINDCQTELSEIKAALGKTQPSGVSTDDLADMNRRQGELETEIAALMAMLDES